MSGSFNYGRGATVYCTYLWPGLCPLKIWKMWKCRMRNGGPTKWKEAKDGKGDGVAPGAVPPWLGTAPTHPLICRRRTATRVSGGCPRTSYWVSRFRPVNAFKGAGRGWSQNRNSLRSVDITTHPWPARIVWSVVRHAMDPGVQPFMPVGCRECQKGREPWSNCETQFAGTGAELPTGKPRSISKSF